VSAAPGARAAFARRVPGSVRGALLRALPVVAAAALVLGLVCGRAGGAGGPPDAAAGLVPAGALVYVHLATDPDRAQDQDFAATASRLPPLRRLGHAAVAAIAPRALDYGRDIRPWLGPEVAYAALSPADSVVLAAVADRPAAEAQVARIGNLSAAGRYRGVRVLRAGATAIAFAGGFLALGTEPAVRAVIDRSAGVGEPLASDPGYERASAGRPADRVLDAYASPAGVRTVLAARGGPLGALGRLLERPGLEGVGAAVGPAPGGLRAAVRLAGGAPRDAAFEPLLADRLPADAAAYVGVRGAGRLIALAERLGAGGVGALVQRLAGEARIDAERDLLAPLGDEVAVALTGSPAGAAAPVLTLKAATSDRVRTASALARLQRPVARLLAVPGTVPAFAALPTAGADAYTMPITPDLAPSYAVGGHDVTLATAPSALGPPRGALPAASAFAATVGDVPDRADSLVFLDLRALLALGEATGLTAIPGLATAREGLARAGAAGAVVTQDHDRPTDTTAELFLQIP
jgi:Protein of unknown function (DUF3352)